MTLSIEKSLPSYVLLKWDEKNLIKFWQHSECSFCGCRIGAANCQPLCIIAGTFVDTGTIFWYKLVRPIQVIEGGRFCLPYRIVFINIFEIPAPLMTTSFHNFGSMLRSERCNTLYHLYSYWPKKRGKEKWQKHDRFPKQYNSKYFGTSKEAEQAFWWSSDCHQMVLRWWSDCQKMRTAIRCSSVNHQPDIRWSSENHQTVIRW